MTALEAFSIGVGVGAIIAAPFAAPLGLWLFERSRNRPSRPVNYRRWPQ